MRIRLENETVRAEIHTKGAQLRSLVSKSTGQEYMWNGDERYWGDVSPLLFPFIGMLQDGAYRHGGKEYSAPKHGFVRREEFQVVVQKPDWVVMSISDTEAMKEMYPFSFCLEAEYRLEKNGVSVSWRVTNKSQEVMPFSIGGHPAFFCPPRVPGEEPGRRTECFLHLTARKGKEKLLERRVVSPRGLLEKEGELLEHREGALPIAAGLFDRDALLLVDQLEAVALQDKAGRDYVKVTCDAPAWGIWSVKSDEAGYVCIEPWWGLCDSEGYQGELSERPLTNFAGPGETWTGGYRIELQSL